MIGKIGLAILNHCQNNCNPIRNLSMSLQQNKDNYYDNDYNDKDNYHDNDYNDIDTNQRPGCAMRL